MSARSATTRTTSRRPPARRRPARRRTLVRRWLLLLGGLVVAAALASAALAPFLDKAVHEVTLPLRHEDIIRQQARAKHLDPALIAAVIYTESRFRDQTSEAGAKGLMQLLPATAHDIAR